MRRGPKGRPESRPMMNVAKDLEAPGAKSETRLSSTSTVRLSPLVRTVPPELFWRRDLRVAVKPKEGRYGESRHPTKQFRLLFSSRPPVVAFVS